MPSNSGTDTSRVDVVRTDGVCVICDRRQNELTEISIGSGFIQLCDDCRPYIEEGLDAAE